MIDDFVERKARLKRLKAKCNITPTDLVFVAVLILIYAIVIYISY